MSNPYQVFHTAELRLRRLDAQAQSLMQARDEADRLAAKCRRDLAALNGEIVRAGDALEIARSEADLAAATEPEPLTKEDK